MINFIQPYSYEVNIGKAYNEAIEPLEGWICITDQDTLKFEGFADKVKAIVESTDTNSVITCVTNRLRRDNSNVLLHMYDEADIDEHFKVYRRLWREHGPKLYPTREPVAGVFMLFHKSVWEGVKFTENAINFDRLFTDACKVLGCNIMVAKGLYIFHLYRWGRQDPGGYVQHLFNRKNK